MRGWGQRPGNLTLHLVAADSDVAACGNRVERESRVWAPSGKLEGSRGRIVGHGCARCNAAILREVQRARAAETGECQCANGPIHPRKSPRQLECLVAVEQYGSRRAAAQALGMSINTLRNNLARLYCALGVTNAGDARARLASLPTEPEATQEPPPCSHEWHEETR